jgi:hypothetical protein
MNFKNLMNKISKTKVWRVLPNVCDFQKENHTLGYEFKNLQKVSSLAYGFLFFVSDPYPAFFLLIATTSNKNF